MLDRARAPETIAAQTLFEPDPTTGALIPSVSPSSTYERAADNSYPLGRIYSRADNPTYDIAADTLTALEGGAASLLFSSGMAAATAVFQTLKPGDRVVASSVMYWALRGWLLDFATRWGLRVDLVDTSDLGAVAAALRAGPVRLIWLETPANPLWKVSDIAAISELRRNSGASLAVDSTTATPVLTRPLSRGAEIVMHSATKYLNGHSDVVAGTLTTAREDTLWENIKLVQRQNGAVIGPFEAWLLQRGMRTLYPRVRWQCASAQTLAERLAAHPAIADVLYPGLPSFSGHDVAKRQMCDGFGGMLSIRVRGGAQAAIAVAAKLRVWRRATSLGGVESLVEHRASIEGPASPVPDDLLRLSVGLESIDDLWNDLETALAQ
jgi:cystathionine gamma-synthase